MVVLLSVIPSILSSGFPVSLIIFSLLLLSTASLSSLQSTLVTSWFVLDEISLFMFIITLFVMYCSHTFAPRSPVCSIVLISISICCFGVFMSPNILSIYFFYEASLLPIIFIILNWGSYPERSLSSVMLLVYTVVFTLPFMYVLFYSFTFASTFSLLLLNDFSSSFALSLIIFLCFSVNLPIYGLHFWLPIAHVEAPTFGSIILAGVLLKLGGVGLIRVALLYSGNLYCLLSYCIVSLVLVTILCCYQSDINRLIAFSSVSHIIALPPLIILGTDSSVSSCILIMLIHGMSSPLLFSLVGFVYSSLSTRQLVFLRGCLVTYPILSFICLIAFLYSLSAPPFPSFVSEVIFITCSIFLTPFFIPFLIVFCFLSLLYNLNWLSSLLFSAPTSIFPYSLTFSHFLPMTVILLSAPFLILILGVV